MTTTPKTLDGGGLVVINDGTDEVSWLADRRGLYTATQVTAIAGSNPYTKVIDVWNSFTDPDFDPDAERNRWLEERAAFGQEREPEIIKWASEDPLTGGPGNPFVASKALVTLPELVALDYASTPDGFKFARDNALVLIECKASQQKWEQDGIPQHIYDQTQWQMFTTGAVTVWLAQDLVEWRGRGANKQAHVVGRYLVAIHPDPNRLAFLLSRVEWFKGLVRDGIAPESDIDLRDIIQAEPDPFLSDDDELAAWTEAVQLDEYMSELAQIREEIAPRVAREAELVKLIKPVVTAYEGRRIHMIGERFIAKLVRGTKVTNNTKLLPLEDQRRIQSWAETETLRLEPNPEYVAAPAADIATESE